MMDEGSGIRDDLVAMRRYARSLTRDEQDADDVVQDAIVRAIERQETFQPDRDRRRWLLAIVHNVFFSAKRREASEARRNSRFAETLVDRLEPGQEEHARLVQIARQFAALPEHHRAVLHLTAIEGFSYQQAAETLGVPVGTVMSRLARARAALREREQGQQGATGLRLIGGSDD
ncbi:sigma-70 family RNA polymerase sigma factor [Sphingobium fuliginis]|nr:RNA polymerase subunit sigma [Sphingobium sp. 20006FA]QOT73285.1 sigma-70 family RNA polymerase sigma factor [Sphingobium fuliginis]RYL99978.1 sigma-70 family RNA polymerase sigma factor [Sphingobium fuliginis]